jgi:hypothetical protein
MRAGIHNDPGRGPVDLFRRAACRAGGPLVTRFQPRKLAERAARLHELGRHEEADRVERILAAVGHCRHCGRTLTDPTSIERGIGSTCWENGAR